MVLRLSWKVAIGSYLLFMTLVLAPIWSTQVEPKWDGRDFNYPKFAYAVETVKSGALPLWDPYTNCGQPFFADPQLAWYNPAALAAGLLRESPFDGYVLFWTLLWVWAGLGALFLAATLGAGPAGSLVAAISFALGGFFVGHGQHLPHLVTAAWSPWVIALGHMALTRQSWAWVLLTGGALGLSALGGYPGLVIFEVLALALWLALAFLLPFSGPALACGTAFRKRLLWYFAATAVPTAILLVIWSPALYGFLVEAQEFTSRTSRPDLAEVLKGHPFSFQAALSFLFPSLTLELRGLFPADISMNNAYLGALGLPLAIIWFAAAGRRGGWLLALSILWFWISLGGDAGLRSLLHYLAPPTDYMRYNGALRLFFLIPLTAAAGLGFSRLCEDTGPLKETRRLFGVWMFLSLAVASLVVWWFGPRDRILSALAPAVALIFCAWAILWFRAVRPSKIAILALLVLAGGDGAWHLYNNSFTVWQSGQRPSIRDIEALGKTGHPAMARDASPVFRITSLNLVNRKPVVEGFVSLLSPFNEFLVPSRFVTVLSAHRYWLSPSAKAAPSLEEGLQILGGSGAFDPVPVFVPGGADPIPGPSVPAGSYGRVAVVSYQPERVVLDLYAPGDAMLVSTERYAPSWQVTVNGRDEPVVPVNYFFRGVRIPPGIHRVVFSYQPRAFAPLLLVSYATLLGVLAGALLLARREKRTSPPRREGHGA